MTDTRPFPANPGDGRSGRRDQAIGRVPGLSPGTVEKHIAAIFDKPALPPPAGDHRRVLAVPAWLRGAPPAG